LKKTLLFFLLLYNTVYPQESKILEFARKSYHRNNYNGVISYLNSALKAQKIENKSILSEIKLYLGLSYYQNEKEYQGISQLEEALKLNPNLKIDTTEFKEKTVEFFENMRKDNIGRLEIETMPEGAEVFIESEYKGKTPLSIENVFSDGCNITVLKDRYEMVSREYFIEPGIVNHFETQLKRDECYSVFITSEPEGAEVTFDDIFKGYTPLFMTKILTGTYKLKLKKEMFKEYSDLIKIPHPSGSIIDVKLQPIKDYFLYSLLIPGLGQVKMGNYGHGIVSFCAVTGFLFYYNNFRKTEPDWIYEDITFMRIIDERQETDTPYIFRIGDRIIDFKTYMEEELKKEEEDIRRMNFRNKKFKIIAVGCLFHALNLLDTWYLIKKIKKHHLSFQLFLKMIIMVYVYK